MKNKIYSKLYKFCDIKTWAKDVQQNNRAVCKIKYYTKFYKEYKLEFQNTHTGWFYVLYKGSYNDYECNASHKGLVTLNKTGKFLMTFGMLIFIAGIRWLLYGYNLIIPNHPQQLLNLAIILGFVAFSILFSFLCISIFHWKFYMILRKVQYYIRNKDNIKRKEEEEELNKTIVTIVNNTMSKNPKLARKTKLEELKKL